MPDSGYERTRGNEECLRLSSPRASAALPGAGDARLVSAHHAPQYVQRLLRTAQPFNAVDVAERAQDEPRKALTA